MATTEKINCSDALAAIHETASDLNDAGTMDKLTLRRFDDLCLTPVEPLEPIEMLNPEDDWNLQK